MIRRCVEVTATTVVVYVGSDGREPSPSGGENAMKMVWIRVVSGVVLLLVGLHWCLQGSGAMGDTGGMNGQSHWLIIGAVVSLVGLVLVAGGVRKLRARKRS